jgi:hypothetical protein
VTRSPIRATLSGFQMDNDRLWYIDTGSFIGAITEYNDEITAFDPRLYVLDNSFHFGGSSYYVLHTLCPAKGWKVSEIEDRFS